MTVYYRYGYAQMFVEAVEDFFKGPEVALAVSPFERIPAETIADGGISEDRLTVNKPSSRYYRLLSLNGLLLPSKGEIVVGAEDFEAHKYYRVGKTYYLRPNGTVVVYSRDVFASLKYCVRAVICFFKVVFRFGRMRKLYGGTSADLVSEKKWEVRWGIDGSSKK